MYSKIRGRRHGRQSSLALPNGQPPQLLEEDDTTETDPTTDNVTPTANAGPAPAGPTATAAQATKQPQETPKPPSVRVSDTLYSFKLLDALRTGDPEALQPFLMRARNVCRATNSDGEQPSHQPTGPEEPAAEITELTSPLHLAMRCAEDAMISRLLMYQDLDVNARDVQHGNTPLHLASMAGRADAIKQLLERKDIDDLVRNKQGLEPMEIASTPAIASLFQVSRAELNAAYLRALANYESSNSRDLGVKQLVDLLTLNRYRALDLNAPSPQTGETILHAAVRHQDTRMIELAATKGADVFAGDKHGKPCIEATKDEKLRALLRQLGNTNTTLAPNGGIPLKPPTFKGWLGKWTNLAGRYKPRWFVLENGLLSYYHSPQDQGRQVRGSIHLQFATVKVDNVDALRFEVLSQPGKKGVVDSKLYLRGSHPAERARWVQMLHQTQAYFSAHPQSSSTSSDSLEPLPTSASGTSATTSTSSTTATNGSLPPPTAPQPATANAAAATRSPPIVIPKPRVASVANNGQEDDWSVSYASRPSHSASTEAMGQPSPVLTNEPPTNSAPSRPASSTGHRLSRMANSITGLVKSPNRISSPIGLSSLTAAAADKFGGGGGRTATPVSNKYAQSYNGTDITPPHASRVCGDEDDASLLYGEEHGSTMTGDLYGKSDPSDAKLGQAGLPLDNEYSLLSNSLTTRAELTKALAELMVNRCASGTEVLRDDDGSLVSDGGPVDTLSTRLAMRDGLISIVDLLAQYQSVVERRESYLRRRYDQEISAKLLWEENLKELAKQYEATERKLAQLTEDSDRKRRMIKELRNQLAAGAAAAGVGAGTGAAAVASIGDETAASQRANETPKPSLDKSRAAPPAGAPSSFQALALQDLDGDTQSDSEDEFFDAVERGGNVTVESQLTEPPRMLPQLSQLDSRLVHVEGVKPYENMRTHMPIGKDVRPSVSLWGVLRNNIGKDLTKISFPVSFNEPTSMLQRMAEDMEFSECLDAAARTEDSTKRIAYVAAFAMSNYSSTIGRIAKPFNPMLGETFEYIAPDKEYRYLSEQVSHHPPISACFAESPGWQYFGCVDAKSKFLGRTFEIRPTGVAHANLKIPEEWVKASWTPDKQAEAQPNPGLNTDPEHPKFLEHYTWNKVTTCVSGFLIGQTTIDHYGDMEVTNHATGDRCVLTFKQRGWRSKDAYGIKGAVYDAQGNLRWEIAGRWNSQLVARRIGTTDEGELNPDYTVRSAGPIGSKPEASAQHLLLWKNSEKPPSPFNLPPFAITLNDLPPSLHQWLPPTDCRLRPDLRAFETGKFDEANSLKIGLEELQRATRRKREAGELAPHKPRWFSRTIDPDSKDVLWAPHKQPVDRLGGKDKFKMEVPEYWLTRDQIGGQRLQAQSEDVAAWPNVEHVFGDLEVK